MNYLSTLLGSDWHSLLFYVYLLAPFIGGYLLAGSPAGRSKKPLIIGIVLIIALVTLGLWYSNNHAPDSVTPVEMPHF